MEKQNNKTPIMRYKLSKYKLYNEEVKTIWIAHGIDSNCPLAQL